MESAKTISGTSAVKLAVLVSHGLVAAFSISLLLVFVIRHPLGPVAGAAIAASVIGLMSLRRDAWLFWLPALAPVIDLAAWTGEIHFAESDCLVLGALLVSSLRELSSTSTEHRSRSWVLGPLSIGLIGLVTFSYVLSTQWSSLASALQDRTLWLGYDTPLNGPRVAKGFVWALLLLPYLSSGLRRRQEKSIIELTRGLIVGATLVALACIWERAAFPGITNFFSDYRTTALFWEMNVGGAILDGWLALTVPFVLWRVIAELRDGEGYRGLFGWLLLLAMIGYAVFTTFSRGLYLGLAVALPVLVLQMFRDVRFDVPKPLLILLCVFTVVVGVLFAEVFRTGGYRGMLAFVGFAAAVYGVGFVVRSASANQILTACLATAGLTALSVASMGIPKGIYVMYALNAALLSLAGLRFLPLGTHRHAISVALTLLFWLGANATLVSVFWAEGKGIDVNLLCMLALFLPAFAGRFHPRLTWQPSRIGGGTVGLALSVVIVAVVMSNTYYASSRLESTSTDLEGRWQHWSYAASLVQTDEQRLLGVGTGKFAEHYFWRAPNELFPGNHRLQFTDGDAYIALDAPRHMLGFGEFYRVSQRVAPGAKPPFALSVRVRAPNDKGNLAVEVCRKHLLYDGGCSITRVPVPKGDGWQTGTKSMQLEGLGDHSGLLPRLTVFSIANDSRTPIDVDQISLIDANGKELLSNGGFTRGSDFWFFSSDRHHLPWHAKNLWLHYYVEQGYLGVAAFGMLGLLALLRLSTGQAVRHPLAAPLLASIVAFFIVGLFDSLVDAPRLATLAFIMLFTALGLRRPRLRSS